MEKDKEAFNEKRLRRLLMVPATRLRVYNNLLLQLRPLIPATHPLGLMVDHALPLLVAASAAEAESHARLAPDDRAALCALPLGIKAVESPRAGLAAAEAALVLRKREAAGLRLALGGAPPDDDATRAALELEVKLAELAVTGVEARCQELRVILFC